MSKQSRFFGMRCALSGLVLAAAFECLADPVLSAERDVRLAEPQGENRLPDIVPHSDRRLMESDPLQPPPGPEIDEIRLDDAMPGRRPYFGAAAASRFGAAPDLPGNYGNAFGQDDSLRNQLLRDFANPGANPAGAPATGFERSRRGGASEIGANPLEPVQAMLRDAVENALKLIRDSVIDESEMVTVSIVGVDFNLTLSGGRPSLTIIGSDVLPTVLYDPVNEELRQGPLAIAPATMQGHSGQSAVGGGGPAQTWGPAQSSSTSSGVPQGASSTDGTPRLATVVRQFATDPMTIIIALGGFILWVAYEIASAVRDRRRLRRYRRHGQRART